MLMQDPQGGRPTDRSFGLADSRPAYVGIGMSIGENLRYCLGAREDKSPLFEESTAFLSNSHILTSLVRLGIRLRLKNAMKKKLF